MIVTCGCCGFDGHVHQYHAWFKPEAKLPDLWICDICARGMPI